MPFPLLPLLAAGATAGASYLARPRYRNQEYQPSEWSNEAWAALQKLLGGGGLQEKVEKGAARTVGRTQATAYRQARGAGLDPALLAQTLRGMSQGAGREASDASLRGALAGAEMTKAGVGGMTSLAQSRDRLEMMIKEMNLRQQERQDQFKSDLLGGLLGLGGSLAGGMMQKDALIKAAEMLQAGGSVAKGVSGVGAGLGAGLGAAGLGAGLGIGSRFRGGGGGSGASMTGGIGATDMGGLTTEDILTLLLRRNLGEGR